MTRILQVTSRDNPRVKEARRVRDGRQRDKIFVEGVRLLQEAVRSNVEIDCLFVSNEGRARSAELVEAARASEVYQLGNSAFQSIADTVTSQGILGLAERPRSGREAIEERLQTASLPLAVFLHETNNPSNLGAIVRTAEAAGAAGVIVSSGSADPFSPKGLRAAMGSSFRLPIWTESTFEEAVAWAIRNGLQTVATRASASTSYTDIDWKQPCLLIMGSEAHGLSDQEAGQADLRISIPMERAVESLNLAVACGIILFEGRRQNATA
jgi:RNA methyltransferase, TrmH family